MDLVKSDDQEALKGFLRNQSDNQEAVDKDTLDTHLVHTSGSSFSATMEFSRTTVDGEPCIQIIIRDRSNAKELEQKTYSAQPNRSVNRLIQSTTFDDLVTGKL